MSMLSVKGTDVIASVEIPKINVDLSIYHGTDTDVLSKGVGHLSLSSLPVGGKGTHAVLTGHTGFSRLKLFSDVNRLVKGDVFFIHVLGETLAYKVDEIRVVLPDEVGPIVIDPEEDYVTLITCTPFGINSHRLMVRGSRTEYKEAKEKAIQQAEENTESTWAEEYKFALIAGGILLAALLILLFGTRAVIIAVINRRRNKNEKAPLSDEAGTDSSA